MSSKTQHRDRYKFQWSLLSPRYWLTWLGLVLYFLVTLMPMSVIDWLGMRLGRYAATRNKKRFNIARENLSLCFPKKNAAEIEQMVFSHFQAQFRSVLHYYILWWRPVFWVRNKIETQGLDQISNYQKQDKKVIVLLPHYVGLEFALAAIAMEYSVIGLYKTMRNQVINWVIARGRLRFGSKSGGKIIKREDGLRPLIREMRAGKILIYLADEDLGEKHSKFAPFFGVPKATLPVIGRLAKSTDAVVLPCVCCYQPDKKKYLIKLLPAIEGLSGGDDVTDSTKMNQAIEAAIEVCPVQYLWTLRYFQTRPEGEASVYDS